MSSEPAPPACRPFLRDPRNLFWLLLAGVLGWYLAAFGERHLEIPFRPHAPDLALLAQQPAQIQLHIVSALTALVIGIVLLIGVKGTTLHRTLGWTWVIAMATTAISSLFIRQINGGAFSFIHLLSGWTIIAVPMAVYAARRHNVLAHRRGMTGLFVGGLIVAGLFAFLPGRLMWELVLG